MVKASHSERLEFLEGLRGIMAISVVAGHFALVFLPELLPVQEAASLTGGWFGLLTGILKGILVNGDTAVAYFFVLTGFLVGKSFSGGRKWQPQDLLRKSCARYLRLLPMVAGATAFTCLTMVLGLQFQHTAGQKTAASAFLAGCCNFTPTLPFLLRSMVYTPFFAVSAFVDPFWTISYELWGYILCMLACYVFQGSRLRRLGYLVLLVLLRLELSENYVGFLLGVLTADLWYQRAADTSVFSRYYQRLLNSRPVVWSLLAAGFCLSFCPVVRVAGILRISECRALGMAMLLYGLLGTPKLQRLLQVKWLLWLGKRSFGIYAFHWPLMLSLNLKLFDILLGCLPYGPAAWVSFLLTVPVILAAGHGARWLFEIKCSWEPGALLEKLQN